MSTFLELSSVKTPDFFHSFTVNFARAPVVLHPLQYGVINLQMVYLGTGHYLCGGDFFSFSVKEKNVTHPFHPIS